MNTNASTFLRRAADLFSLLRGKRALLSAGSFLGPLFFPDWLPAAAATPDTPFLPPLAGVLLLILGGVVCVMGFRMRVLNKKLTENNRRMEEEAEKREHAETLLQEKDHRLEYEGLHDLLTELPNRNLFMNRLEHVTKLYHRNPEYDYVVLYLDLDGFKVINEGLGHDGGDKILAALSERLDQTCRETDTLARLGGDDFALLIEGEGARDEAIPAAERLFECLRAPFHITGLDVALTASIGIVLGETRYQSAKDILRDAETAMYRAKQNGKGHYQIFQEKMHIQAISHMRTATDLRKAIERREFILYYQPIVDLEKGAVAGFEALIRWLHPERGFVSPGDFIPVAEETGLIVPIGNLVLEEACRTISRMERAMGNGKAHPYISANLSVLQLSQENVAKQIQEAIQTLGFSATNLKLEITETLLMKNAFNVIPTLEMLRMLGVHLAIDDFGTGYSSLSYLNYLPVDTLKIDKVFVDDLGLNERSEERIVQTILNLAETLKMTVIAEGVENDEQCLLLKALGCTFVQGYLFGKPMPWDEASAMCGKQLFDPNVVWGTK